MMEKSTIEELANLAVRRAIIIPSFEIYGEIGGFYDYGPIGTRIKRNIEQEWRKVFIEELGNIEIETTLIAPEQVFEASGHLKNFTDPLAICEKCHAAYRADKLLEEYFEKKGMNEKLSLLKGAKPEELEAMLKDYKIKCEKCGTPLEKVSVFNLMLKTGIGPLGAITGYLRPETAQGIFLDFKRIYNTYGLKLPVGIGQMGKVFRNEISPRRMLIRLREFSQMELEYFFDPDEKPLVIGSKPVGEGFLDHKVNFLSRADQLKGGSQRSISLRECLDKGYVPNMLFAFLLFKESQFLSALGFPSDSIRFREMLPDELPHYSKGNVDAEARFGDSFEEIIGNAYRTNFDLKNHQEHSGTDMGVLNGTKKLIPSVDEISFGIDRIFWTLLYNSMFKDNERGWEVMLLKKNIAPYRCAIFPLQKDEELVKKAQEVAEQLDKNNAKCYFAVSGSIGKRYAKADEIGIPKAVTIDYQTIQDDTVTIRSIEDTKQVRAKISELNGLL